CHPLCACRRSPASTARHALSLHDALPIFPQNVRHLVVVHPQLGSVFFFSNSSRISLTVIPAVRSTRCMSQPFAFCLGVSGSTTSDRKSTRLNSSHVKISYAAFCLRTKNRW